jgi:hypothetical protein
MAKIVTHNFAHAIAIEKYARHLPSPKLLLHLQRKRAFTRTGQAGDPNDAAR